MQYQVVQQRSQSPTTSQVATQTSSAEDKVTLSSNAQLANIEKGKHIDLANIEKARHDPIYALEQAQLAAGSTALKEVFFHQNSGGITELYADGSRVTDMQSLRYQLYKKEYETFGVQAQKERQERVAFVNKSQAEGMPPFEIYKQVRQDFLNNWPTEPKPGADYTF